MGCVIIHKTPLEVLMRATRISHKSEDRMDTIGDELGPNDEKLLEAIVKMGHHSVLEHVVYSIHVYDVSRALLQQLARHRHTSLTVQSTRFTLKKVMRNLKDLETRSAVDRFCVVPPIDGERLERFYESAYRSLMDLFEMIEDGVENDFSKYVLPECFKTELILTTNARELMHIIDLRLKESAMWEFRRLVRDLLRSLFEVHPDLWKIIASEMNWILEFQISEFRR